MKKNPLKIPTKARKTNNSKKQVKESIQDMEIKIELKTNWGNSGNLKSFKPTASADAGTVNRIPEIGERISGIKDTKIKK